MVRTEPERVAAATAALEAFGGLRGCRCSVVELHIDGNRFAVEFDLDRGEHRRRQALGIGPATNTGLLHALWELPAGISVPAGCLSEKDLATLGELGEGYVECTDDVSRTFSPAGTITAVVVVADGMDEAITRVSRLPPIFRRLAVAFRHPCRDQSTASKSGIGSAVFASGGIKALVAPGPAVRGVPAVYRWWLGEIAYRNWGQANCAHCVI